ncbi:flagellar biosynthesis protein FliO [Yersinia pseudotuberculosis]|uniref:flagellar biosynthetic protein FliO n=1 Tax=Yersinia pseudotuberculosis TaxID=633 RepID=UPI0004F69C07|nr:flagellar biosynthetic protein FliO [Yersinia pseudotuberculosis]AIN14210.1 flagellar biosynthetic protein FliO [Yersinia pseudotuberculosis]AJJ05353.1 flagellar biosynthetic protein FliO [Yersinia pseudotuberculosis]CNJ56879.1 flagellar biosynthesis protein FliO [Yersinia pseudotuberculosis]SUQ17045.1 flagellar biosynthesis protein FliO [Yersinia pseudotuberculosis]
MTAAAPTSTILASTTLASTTLASTTLASTALASTTTQQTATTGFAASHPGSNSQLQPSSQLQPQSSAAPPAMPAGGVLTQVGSALGGILLLILFVAWLVRRLGFAPQARNSKLLNMRASCQVGQRERVVIVEVDDTWLVLGVTAQQVTPLHTLARPVVEAPRQADGIRSTSNAQAADFRQLLNKILKHPEKSA